MGEKIRTLTRGKFLNSNFEIELNHPTTKRGKQQIHLQSDKFRFELDMDNYTKYALLVLLAEKNLKNLKDIK